MRIVFVASVILIRGGCQCRMTKLNLNTTLNFIPSPGQQTFPQSQLSVQTLMVQLHALTSMPTLKIPSIGSHTTVWTSECSIHFVHPQAWNVVAIAAVELKTHMQFISCKGDVRPLQKEEHPQKQLYLVALTSFVMASVILSLPGTGRHPWRAPTCGASTGRACGGGEPGGLRGHTWQ